MSRFDVGLKVAHYKAFGAEPQGFDRIMPVNVIIGRNNSGKSSLIDLVELASKEGDPGLGHSRAGKGTVVTLSMDLEGICDVREVSQLAESPPERNLLRTRLSKVGFRWIPGRRQDAEFDLEEDFVKKFRGRESELLRAIQLTARNLLPAVSPIAAKKFHRLRAERRIASEPYNFTKRGLSDSGSGFTNLVHQFLINSRLDRRIVQRRLLDSLNKIFEGEAYFKSILVKQDEELAEIFLEEDDKDDIALSQSGSGLQTVLLVLGFLELLPALASSPNPGEKLDLKDWIFAFEELENNLHPSLQRKLLSFIRDRAVEDGATVFLTTHSPVVVDLFAEDKQAQIIHVTHNGTEAIATPVLTYSSQCRILNDLDVRASDLLQANGVIWVEGPSDRIYLKRWITLWSEATGEALREGRDYQCVVYGGKLLSHFSADGPGDEDCDDNDSELIELLRVNRHAVVVMDRDWNGLDDQINSTKQRVVEEVTENGGVAWVTAGREIEHYVPHDLFQLCFGDEIPELDQFQSTASYLEELRQQNLSGKRVKDFDKIPVARALVEQTRYAHLKGHLELAKKLDQICSKIRQWNGKLMPIPRTADRVEV